MGTPALDQIRKALWAEYAGTTLVSWGVWNRRPIAGTKTWSQHAWGNAEDVSSPTAKGLDHRTELLDDVAAWLRGHRAILPIGTVLWQVKDHYDHVHYEAVPKMKGTPPKSSQGTGDAMDIVADLGDSGHWVRVFQEALNRQHAVQTSAGFGAAWPPDPLVSDGRFGPKTAEMVRAYQAASQAPVTKAGAIDTRLGLLLVRRD